MDNSELLPTVNSSYDNRVLRGRSESETLKLKSYDNIVMLCYNEIL